MDDYFSIFLSDFRAKHRTDKADRYTLVKEKKNLMMINRSKQATPTILESI